MFCRHFCTLLVTVSWINVFPITHLMHKIKGKHYFLRTHTQRTWSPSSTSFSPSKVHKRKLLPPFWQMARSNIEHFICPVEWLSATPIRRFGPLGKAEGRRVTVRSFIWPPHNSCPATSSGHCFGKLLEWNGQCLKSKKAFWGIPLTPMNAHRDEWWIAQVSADVCILQKLSPTACQLCRIFTDIHINVRRSIFMFKQITHNDFQWSQCYKRLTRVEIKLCY